MIVFFLRFFIVFGCRVFNRFRLSWRPLCCALSAYVFLSFSFVMATSALCAPTVQSTLFRRSGRPTAPRQGNASVAAHTHTVVLTFSLRFRYVFDVCALAAPRLVQKDHCPLSTGHKQMWFWLWLGEKHSHGRALHISYTRVRIVFFIYRFR